MKKNFTKAQFDISGKNSTSFFLSSKLAKYEYEDEHYGHIVGVDPTIGSVILERSNEAKHEPNVLDIIGVLRITAFGKHLLDISRKENSNRDIMEEYPTIKSEKNDSGILTLIITRKDTDQFSMVMIRNDGAIKFASDKDENGINIEDLCLFYDEIISRDPEFLQEFDSEYVESISYSLNYYAVKEEEEEEPKEMMMRIFYDRK